MTGKLDRLRDPVHWLETRLFERKVTELAGGRTS
jgi:hypothetical protein